VFLVLAPFLFDLFFFILPRLPFLAYLSRLGSLLLLLLVHFHLKIVVVFKLFILVIEATWNDEVPIPIPQRYIIIILHGIGCGVECLEIAIFILLYRIVETIRVFIFICETMEFIQVVRGIVQF
jgi:hypothetical protein